MRLHHRGLLAALACALLLAVPGLSGCSSFADTGTVDGEHRMPGAVSRWNAKKDLSWVPLRPELVVEIKYDQLEGRRLRHTGQFLRWRTDRDPLSCTYDQLDIPVKYDLAEVLDG